jgi:hypothetical protein
MSRLNIGADQEIVAIDLTRDESYLLVRGVTEWSGSARCSDELAIALGFKDVADLRLEGERIGTILESSKKMSRWDWTRALFSAEIVFVSSVMGSGLEWETVFGESDSDSLRLLRGIQSKLSAIRVPIGHMVYSLPS